MKAYSDSSASNSHATHSSPSTTNSPNSTGDLVSWKPIAARLGLKERAFWTAVHNLGLPHFRINARVLRFRWADVEQWLSNHRKGVL